MITELDRAMVRAGATAARRRASRRAARWGAEVTTYDAATGKTFARLDGATVPRQVQPMDAGPFSSGERVVVDRGGVVGAPTTVARCRVHRTNDFNVPINVTTAVPFPTADTVENYNVGNIHSLITDTSRFTAVRAGEYILSGGVRWPAGIIWSGGAALFAGIRVDGGEIIAGEQQRHEDSSIAVLQNPATSWYFAAGEYAELVVFQSAIDPLAVDAVGERGCWFAMSFLHV